MKLALKDTLKTFLIALFSLYHLASFTEQTVTPYISIRSQGQNSALEMVGWSFRPHNEPPSAWYGDLSLSTGYQESFRSNEIAQTLFGCYATDDCTSLNIKGSSLTNRTENDLLADWFYLPSDYQGSISLKPRIQNSITFLNFSLGSDEWLPGLSITVRAPIVWTRWNLNSVFFTEDEGTIASPSGTLLNNAEKFFCPSSSDTVTTLTTQVLSCARFGCHSCDNTGYRDTTRLSDIQTNINYKFNLKNDSYALGIFARLVIPTGTAPHGDWLFEPIVGNGKHWELGMGIQGNALLWQNDEDCHCGFYGDATITHLFSAQHTRVFDLKCKPLSRYMTAAHFVGGIPTEYAPLANLTACAMKVSVGIQTDIVTLFNYSTPNWSYDIGYNLWVRSTERFHGSSHKNNACCGNCIIKNGTENWGISTIGSSSTTSLSTIVEKAAADSSPIFITDNDIDYESAQTKGLSNKLFAHFSYNWLDHVVTPYLGMGGEIEFGGSYNCCSTKTLCSKNSTLSQWGLWLKGGASF